MVIPAIASRFGVLRLGRVLEIGALASAMTAAVGRGATAQEGPVVFGTVRAAVGGAPLPYSVVAIPSSNREQLTSDQGGYTLRDLPVGRVTLRYRHIGFSPRDTEVVLRAGDTLRVDVALDRLAIQLDAIHISAACSDQDEAGSRALSQLFEQVRQNAAQYRLLVKSHPFTRRISRADVVRMTDGKFVASPVQVLEMNGSADAAYRPGQVFRPRRGINRSSGIIVVLPELPDFADSVFLAYHCFSYRGDTTIDSARMVRVGVFPIATWKEPDIAGEVLLRADNYSLASFDIRTTGIPKYVADEVSGIRVVTEFADIVPGIGVVSRIESFREPGPEAKKLEPQIASRGEIQQLVEIKWKKGPP